MTDEATETIVGYVMRYGGRCRDCADMDGVCQSGMPCYTDQRRAVIMHTIAALTYGINNGFIASPFPDIAALAAAEERGRIEERERCAQIADEHALSCAAKINKKRSDHDLAVFESAASEAMSIAHCIRKEPTP